MVWVAGCDGRSLKYFCPRMILGHVYASCTFEMRNRWRYLHLEALWKLWQHETGGLLAGYEILELAVSTGMSC